LQDGGVGEVLGGAGLPLGGAGGVDAGAERVDGEDAGGLDGLGDEVGRAADRDEVDGVELADGRNRFRAALGLADGASRTVWARILRVNLSRRVAAKLGRMASRR
jgi:hypothetical protein